MDLYVDGYYGVLTFETNIWKKNIKNLRYYLIIVVYTETLFLPEKDVYQTLLVLRLLFLTAWNIISHSYYIEYVYCEFIDVIIRVVISC